MRDCIEFAHSSDNASLFVTNSDTRITPNLKSCFLRIKTEGYILSTHVLYFTRFKDLHLRCKPWIRGTAYHEPYHEPTLPSTEHQVGNQCADQVAAPGLQLTQVDPLTTQVGIILSELREEIQILISVPNELDCFLPGDGAVSVGSGEGHRLLCLLHVSYHRTNGSEGQFLNSVGVRHQLIHAVLLQLQDDAAVLVRFAQPQECLDSVVAGHADPQSTIHGVAVLHQHNLAGGHAASSNQAGSVSVVEQAGNLKGIMIANVAAACVGIRHRHHHPVIGVHHLIHHPGSQGISGDSIQGIGANLIQQVAGLLHHGGALILIPTTGGGDESAEVVKAGGVQQVIRFGGVHPVKGSVLQSCLMLDADRGSTRHGVRFVLGTAQVGDGFGEQVGSVEQSDGVVLVSNAFVMN